MFDWRGQRSNIIFFFFWLEWESMVKIEFSYESYFIDITYTYVMTQIILTSIFRNSFRFYKLIKYG